MKLLPDSFYSKQAQRFLLLGLLVPCLLVAVMAIIGFRTERQLAGSVHWVSHTLEVRSELQQLLATILQAESSQRGYLLTDRDSYLEPYRSSVDRLPREVAGLRGVTADNPVQQENLHLLDSLLAEKLKFMADTIADQKQGNHEGALAMVLTERGKQTMDAITGHLQTMQQEETRLLKRRQDNLAANTRLNSGVLMAMVALNVLFALSMLGVLHRLYRLHGLVTVCAWSRTVEYNGKWLSFEQYLQERFHLDTSHGISPAEAEKAFGIHSHQPDGLHKAIK